ncbi:hypothetical protein L6452_36045 [Arctium lappa]|uniref:Uncharacterized protein n=1 Tax=Arctium lappa TaxID=4217 RepID=A0ACB8Y832_ARCLA|nr:hypothetical protein L6452_36045 [Arctium lappa]
MSGSIRKEGDHMQYSGASGSSPGVRRSTWTRAKVSLSRQTQLEPTSREEAAEVQIVVMKDAERFMEASFSGEQDTRAQIAMALERLAFIEVMLAQLETDSF